MAEHALTAGRAATVLCVDDEEYVLSALRRLLTSDGYRVLCAGGGTEGLQVFQAEPVDLVISDMHMPGMSGAKFLAEVRSRWPRSVRILLTGHADLESTITAINQGEIYRYIAKPWHNDEVRIIVRQALERQYLADERGRLEAITVEQNRQLRNWNAELEARIEVRTAELRREHNRVLIASEKLKTGFAMSIKVFAHLIELGEGRYAGHSQRVADLAMRIAKRLELDRDSQQDLLVASLLHDIGKTGMPDTLLSKPYAEMSPEDMERYKQHAITGSLVLMAIEELRPAARILRAHHERFDGSGYPDGLRGDGIPLGARILAVANDFDAMQIGIHEREMLTEAQAMRRMLDGRGKHYDPHVVDAFDAILQEGLLGLGLGSGDIVTREVALTPEQLEPGMVTTRDLLSQDGVLMLHHQHVLDAEMIGLIAEFSRAEEDEVVVHVDADRIPS